MAQATIFSAASTYTVFTGTGTYYGMTARRVAGGTVALFDSLDIGHRPDINNAPSTISGTILSLGPANAAANAIFIGGPGIQITNGLIVSITSTKNVTIHYDE